MHADWDQFTSFEVMTFSIKRLDEFSIIFEEINQTIHFDPIYDYWKCTI